MGRDAKPWYRKAKRCWYVWHEGAQRRLHPEKDEALRLWHELETSGEPGGACIGDLIDAYLSARADAWKPRTLKSKREFLDRLKRERGRKPVDDSLRDWVRKPTWGVGRRWLASLILKAMTSWGAGEGKILTSDPLEGWRMPAPKSRGEDALIPPEAHATLLANAPECYRLALTFLHATGCRPSEACSLTASDVNLEAGVAILKQHKTEAKTSKPRLILLPDSLKPTLALLMERNPTGSLFRHARGGALTLALIERWMYRNCKKLKLPPYTPYGYRHTLATDSLAAGVPDSHVAALLGHSSTNMLHRHYNHLLSKVQILKDAANRAR